MIILLLRLASLKDCQNLARPLQHHTPLYSKRLTGVACLSCLAFCPAALSSFLPAALGTRQVTSVRLQRAVALVAREQASEFQCSRNQRACRRVTLVDGAVCSFRSAGRKGWGIRRHFVGKVIELLCIIGLLSILSYRV